MSTHKDDDKIITFPGASQPDFTLQIRIGLLLMPQPTWRRLLISPLYSFWDLHVAIQDSMGWQDTHLHQFTLDDAIGRRQRFGLPDDSGFHGAEEILPGWDHQVALYLREGLAPALYTYDFGDCWQHEVLLEGLVPTTDTIRLPSCIDGQGACPPEDCGGPGAVEELVAKNLLDADFDPEAVVFDNPRQRWHRSFGSD